MAKAGWIAAALIAGMAVQFPFAARAEVGSVASPCIHGTQDSVSAAEPQSLDDQDYLRRKWRQNVADMSTGRDAATLRRELAALSAKWTQSCSWSEVKARAFAHLCDHVAIDVPPEDWFPAFAHWTRHTAKLHPVLPLIERRSREISAKRFPGLSWNGDGWWMYLDYDHSAPDWDDALGLGFAGMAERLRKLGKDNDFHRTRKLAVEAVFRLLDRLVAQGIKRLRLLPADAPASRRARLEGQLASLRRLRGGAPETTLDVLEFIYLYWVMSENFEGIQVRTLGNLDRLLAPYYRADLAAGRIDEATFRDMLRRFWWQWGSLDNYWGQPVYFGGTKADGTTEYNEVSRILLEVHDELALPTPKVHLKIGASTPDWVWRQTLEMMRRQRSLTFVGEEPHWRVIRSMGYTEDQARTFLVWGCYEWAIRDSANDTCGGTVDLVRPLIRLLEDAEKGRFASEEFGAFKDEYLARMAKTVETARDGMLKLQTCLAEVNPSLLFSLATEASVSRGCDAFAGGMRNGNNTGVWMIGTASAVDSLLAVKELVYETHAMTLADLGRLMRENWKDREDLRLRMARGKRKWGNNDPDANALGRELVRCAARPVNGVKNSRGGVFKASGHSARNHYGWGASDGATPDGRRKGDELSKNISPVMGADTEGATALLATIAHLDACDLPGDFPLDVALLPATVKGEKGLALMRTIVETYFRNGGLVIQFNVVGAETLRDAQLHPEKYENLQVRVCGWNVRWNDIPKKEQDAFILRQERLAAGL